MSRLLNTLQQIKKAQRVIKEATDDLRHGLTDKRIPLDTRWQAFVESGLGEHSGWIEHFEGDGDITDVCESAPLYISKYQTVDTIDAYNQIQENVNEGEEYEGWEPDVYREDVLKKFIRTWEMDW